MTILWLREPNPAADLPTITSDAEIRRVIESGGGTLEDFIRFQVREQMKLQELLAEANNIIGAQNRAIARAHSLLLAANVDDAITFLLDAIEREPSR